LKIFVITHQTILQGITASSYFHGLAGHFISCLFFIKFIY